MRMARCPLSDQAGPESSSMHNIPAVTIKSSVDKLQDLFHAVTIKNDIASYDPKLMNSYQYHGGPANALQSFASSSSLWADRFSWEKAHEPSSVQIRPPMTQAARRYPLSHAGLWENAAFAALGLSGIAAIALALL
jgi:hypothetical protein